MQPLTTFKSSAQLQPLQSPQMQIAAYGGLVIQACGRSLKLPDQIKSIKDIQEWLQIELGMREQVFELYDQHGDKLLRDEDLARAIGSGTTTLTATLSDSSIHLIENRREELAQMQWKLVRDQQHHASMKIAQLSRALAAVEQALQVEAAERTTMDERVKADVAAALERFRNEAALGIRQVEEQCAGVSNMITNERNLREASLQRYGSDLQSIREVIDANREAANQGIAHVQSQTDSYRKLVDNERSFREALDAKVGQDIESMNARMDETAKALQHQMQELRRSFELSTHDMNASFDAHGRNFLKLKTDLENSHTESTAKVGMVEDQIRSLDSRVNDMMERHSETLDRVGQRSEKITLGLESVKADASADRHSVTTVHASVAEVENMMKDIRKEVADRSAAERKRREDELKSFKDNILTEHGTRLAKLENKITARLERESAAREEVVSEIYGGIKKEANESMTKKEGNKALNQSVGSPLSLGLGANRSASQHMLGIQNSGSMSIPIQSLSMSNLSAIAVPGSTSVPNSARSHGPISSPYPVITLPYNASNSGSMSLSVSQTGYLPTQSPPQPVRQLLPGTAAPGTAPVAFANSGAFTPRTQTFPTGTPVRRVM